MKYLVLIHIDPSLRDALPDGEFDTLMQGCIAKADEMADAGTLLMSQQLEDPQTARSLRVRNGRSSITDGPFAETKEFLAGFNLIEAASLEEATEIAQAFPWARIGCVEVRPVRDMAQVRARVGA